MTTAVVVGSLILAIAGVAFAIASRHRREVEASRAAAARATVAADLQAKRARVESTRRRVVDRVVERHDKARARLDAMTAAERRKVDEMADTIDNADSAAQAADVLRRAFDG